MSTASRTLKQVAYQQLKEFLFIALYLWAVFGLLVMFKSVVLAEHHIDFAYHGFARLIRVAYGCDTPSLKRIAFTVNLGRRGNISCK